MRDRSLVAICAAGSLVFMGCFGLAAALYPGGTWFHRHAVGHSFSKNFLCDLMQPHALNGLPAPGAPIARLGTAAMFASVGALFALVARLEKPERMASRIARSAGLFSALIGCTLLFVPSDEQHIAHTVLVLCAFVPALVATIAAVRICVRAPAVSHWIRATAVLTLSAGALDGIAYAYAYAWSFGYARAVQMNLVYASLPMLQRVATVGLLTWVAAVCVYVWRRDGRVASA